MQICTVVSKEDGIEKAKEIIYQKVDKKTVLFLSGGQSPKPLYETLAKEKRVHPAAVAMVDERFGHQPMHENSNEKMIAQTHLLSYFAKEHIPWHGILQKGLSRQATADGYDGIVRNLFFHIPQSLAIISIGPDGHIAGIAPNRRDFHNPLFDPDRKSLLVSEFHDTTGSFGERISLAFQALSMIDTFIVWVFGDEKRKALEQMFEKGSEEEIPARFFQRGDIAEKVTIITDQKV